MYCTDIVVATKPSSLATIHTLMTDLALAYIRNVGNLCASGRESSVKDKERRKKNFIRGKKDWIKGQATECEKKICFAIVIG